MSAINIDILLSEGILMLVNLDGEETFKFQFYPNEINSSDRNNWESQETTIGIKPIFYANREPRLVDIPELYLDSTATNESLTPELRKLQALMTETDETGKPPKLMVIWGDKHEICVLQDLSISEIFFFHKGHPLRARISLNLIQIQEEGGTATSVELIDDPLPTRQRIVGAGTRPRRI